MSRSQQQLQIRVDPLYSTMYTNDGRLKQKQKKQKQTTRSRTKSKNKNNNKNSSFIKQHSDYVHNHNHSFTDYNFYGNNNNNNNNTRFNNNNNNNSCMDGTSNNGSLLLSKAKQLYQKGQLKQSLFYYQQYINIQKQKNKLSKNFKINSNGNRQTKTVTVTQDITCDNNNNNNAYNINSNSVVQAYYQMGSISMAIQNYQKSEQYLKAALQMMQMQGQKHTQIQSNNNKYKSISLLLSICLNKLNKHQQSYLYLNKLCEQKTVDALVYRAKNRLKQMEYQLSYEDYKILVYDMNIKSINVVLGYCQAVIFYARDSIMISNQGIGNSSGFGDGVVQQRVIDARTKIDEIINQIKQQQQGSTNQYNKSQQILTKSTNLKIQILLLYYNYRQAENIINQHLNNYLRSSWTLLQKSKISEHDHKTDEQILLLNQCITLKDNRRSVIQALQLLVLHAMKQKDFYQAFEYSKRSTYIKIQNKATCSLFKIAQAVTFLMKKKYGEALLVLGAIDPLVFKGIVSKCNYQYLSNLYYNSIGYCYFSLGQYKDAIKAFRSIKSNAEDSKHMAHLYNRCLCEGIICYNQGKLEQSIKIFENSTDYLMRAQPYFYISVILIQKNASSSNIDPDLVSNVIQILDTGLKAGQHYQMYCFRGLLYFYLGMNAEALDDVDRAVQKSQQNIARFFYLRGLIFFQEKNYESAIAQFTTCLSIDDKFYDAYLQRAKVKIISQQYEQAYQDLSNHPLSQQWRSLFQLYQHKFTDIIEQKTSQPNIIQIANYQLGFFQQAGPAGKVILAILSQNYEQVINLLQDALDIKFQIGCLQNDDVYLLQCYCLFKTGKYQECQQILMKTQQILKKGTDIGVFGQEDQKKLLSVKANCIFVNLAKKQYKKCIQMTHLLINDVYQGNIYDQLVKLKDHLQKTINQQKSQCKLQFFKSNTMINNYFAFQQIQGLKFKFLVPFPRIIVHELQSIPYESCLQQFTVKQIDNRAEAPWMQKNQFGVIFTNKIEVFQNLKLYTETEDNQFDGENKTNKNRNSKERMKEQLQLDAGVLDKLQKLTKNIGKHAKSDGNT